MLCSVPLFAQYWEEGYTHKLFWGYWSNAIEGSLLVIGFCLATFIFGPQIWTTDLLPFFHRNVPWLKDFVLPLNKVIFWSYIFTTFPALYDNFKKVHLAQRKKYGKNASLIKLWKTPLLEIFPYLIFHLLLLGWVRLFDTTVFAEKTYYFLTLYVFLNGNLTMWKMICKNSGSPYPIFFLILIPLFVPNVLGVCKWTGMDRQIPILHECERIVKDDYFLEGYVLVAICWHMCEYVRLIRAFARFLKLPILAMPKKKKAADPATPTQKFKST